MPLYSYKCSQGHIFERWLPVREYLLPQNCNCGRVGQKVILSPPTVRGDLPEYTSPVTGLAVRGRRQREEDLRRSGCRPYEPEERQDVAARKAREEAVLDASIEQTVGEFIEKLPTKKREELGKDLEHHEVGIQRL